MAALEPHTGDGPLEVEREDRGIVVHTPVDGGGRLVLELEDVEASELKDVSVAVER